MAGYTVTALSLDEKGPTSHFTLAVSVTDSNGLAVQNLSESNFTVRNISSETSVSIAELHSTVLQGYYRLLLKTEPVVNTGEWILALVVTSRHHIAGRVPGDTASGNTMVKMRVV
jgi:hypothetical protein